MVELNRLGGNIRTETAFAKKWGGNRPRWLRYGTSLITVALATVACFLTDPFLPAQPHYLWFLCALLFAVWYGGAGPGFLNLLLGPVVLAFFVLHPRFDFRVESPSEQFGLLLYCMTAGALLIYSRTGRLMREIVKSSLEETSLRDMPIRLEEIESQLAEHIARTDLAQRRMTGQFRVSQILTNATSVEDATRPILQAIGEAVGWDVGLFWLVGPHAEKLQCIESWGLHTDLAEDFQRASKRYAFSKGEGFPGRVWGADSVVWVPDMAKDPDLPRWSLAAKAGLHEAIGCPVRNGIEFLGVMEFLGRKIGAPNEQLVQMMGCLGSQISQFIERRHAEKTVQTLNHERRLARQIQEGLLPAVMPALPGVQIAGRALLAAEVGGDYYDFMPLRVECQDSLGIVIGDAAGHGLASALLIAETRAYLHALALTLNRPETLLSLANRRLGNGANGNGGHFVTLLLIRIDPRKRVLVYAGAGHCPGYVLDHQGQTKAVLKSASPPLGVDLASKFPASAEIALEPGDLIVLFTDGIVEMVSPEGQQFTSECLLASVRQHRKRSPGEILDALFQAATEHAHGTVQSDDTTAVILKVEATP